MVLVCRSISPSLALPLVFYASTFPLMSIVYSVLIVKCMYESMPFSPRACNCVDAAGV